MFRNKKTTLILLVVVLALIVDVAKADFTIGEPTNLGPTINSAGGDVVPYLSPDGLELYFFRGSGNSGNTLVARRATRDSEWEPASKYGSPCVSGDSVSYITPDGLTLFLGSSRPGGSGNADLWVTTRVTVDENWSDPINLGTTVNSTSNDYSASMSTDGLELYFSSNRPGGQGEFDLWVTTRATVADDWGVPENLGSPLNSSTDDVSPSISADGLLLFFTSRRTGGHGSGYGLCDVYVARRATIQDPWGPPMNCGPVANSPYVEWGVSASADGSMLYFHSDQPGGFGSFDIYQAPIIPIIDFNRDGIVDAADVTIMVEHWHTYYPLCDIGPMPWGDGVVDTTDLVILMDYWGHEVDYPYDPRFASKPKPADSSNMLVDKLSWTPGWYATEHDVYIGIDSAVVENADISDTSGVYQGRQDVSDYIPPEELEIGLSFFWRVDEVDSHGTVSKGQLWNFTVADYLVVDDFESYTDNSPNEIFMTWIDGFNNPTVNGSVVGHTSKPYAEKNIVHGGNQSMPFFYDNSTAPISEAFHRWEPQDWTIRGVQFLKLWIYGLSDNNPEPVYIKLRDSLGNSATVTHTDPTVITAETWQQLSFELTDFTGVNTDSITEMYFCVGDKSGTQPGGKGTIYVDDIELYRSPEQ